MQGPLINQRQFDRLCNLVEGAKKSGVKVVTGGEKHAQGDLYFQPTILTNIMKDVDCFKEEIFGPVVSIITFETEKVADEVFRCLSKLMNLVSIYVGSHRHG